MLRYRGRLARSLLYVGALGLSLPAAYREFLLWPGCESPGMLGGAVHVPVHRAELSEVLASDGRGPLPEDAFVFFDYNGYHDRWIHVGEGGGPPVGPPVYNGGDPG